MGWVQTSSSQYREIGHPRGQLAMSADDLASSQFKVYYWHLIGRGQGYS